MSEHQVPDRGWYPNPVGSSAHERFWNGKNWTVRVRPAGSREERHIPVPTPAPSPPQPFEMAGPTTQTALRASDAGSSTVHKGRPSANEAETRWRSTSGQPGLTPERPYGQVRRGLYGSWWTFVAVLLVLGGFASSIGTGLVGLVLGALAGRYAYRIWTWQARSLWFAIFF